jgi:DNA replication protein DnaC
MTTESPEPASEQHPASQQDPLAAFLAPHIRQGHISKERALRLWRMAKAITPEQREDTERSKREQRRTAIIKAKINSSGIIDKYRSANFEVNNKGEMIEPEPGRYIDNHGKPGASVDALSFCIDYAERYEKNARGFILASERKGTGKTYTVSAVCIRLIRRGFTVHFATLSNVLDAYRNSFGKNFADDGVPSAYDIDRELMEPDVLILDDMGTETIKSGESGDWAREKVLSIINSRMDRDKTLIATTNCTKCDKPTPARPSFLMRYGGRIYSRIFENTDWIELEGRKDHRTEQGASLL